MRTNRKWFLSLLLNLSLLLGMVPGLTLTARANNNQTGKIIYSDQDTLDLGGDYYCSNDRYNHINNMIGYLWYNRYIGGQHQFGVSVNNGSIYIYISDSDSRRPYGIQVESGSGTSGDPYKFKVLIHNHSLEYSNPDDKIAITCTNNDHCSLPNQKATLSLSAPTDLIYDGSAKTITVLDSGGFIDTVKSDSRATIHGVRYYNWGKQDFTDEAKDVGQYRAYYFVDVRYSPTVITKYSAYVDFNILPKEARISPESNDKMYGDSDPALTASVTGTVSGEILDYTLKREYGEDVGEYVISVINGSNPNYFVKTDTAVFRITKANASVISPPTAKSLTYNSTAQKIIDAGKAIGGEMQYALGTATEATGPYTTYIPTATDAGTYYVWYMAKGDTNHNDSEAKCVTATIAEKNNESADGIPTEAQETVPDAGEADEQGASFLRLLARQKKVTKNSITFTWSKVPGATSYTLYGCRCGQHKAKKLKTVSGTSYTWNKLKSGKYYKAYVVAQNGSEILAKSSKIHVATSGKKYGNPVSVSVKKKAVRLKVGKTRKIGACVKKKNTVQQHRGIRYESDNPAVATVNKNGKIKAVGKGKCHIYVYAQNGVFAKVKVKVR